MKGPRPAARVGHVAGLLLLVSLTTGQQCAQGGDTGATVQSQGVSVSADADADGVPDHLDNCRWEPNPSQRESARHGVTCQGEEPVSLREDGDVITEIAFGTCSNDPAVACLADRDCLRGNACDCDFDGDGACTIDDYNAFLADYAGGIESPDAGTDMNADGIVDDLDFALFEPLFVDGVPGPGATHQRVVDVDEDDEFVPGGCWERRQARRIQPSEGRSNGPGILDCSVPVDSLPPTWELPGGFSLGILETEAMKQNKENPTDKYVELATGIPNACPNAVFSTSSKTAPKACDNHDLCGSSCGTTGTDCDLQFARDLFNTCEALAGDERDACYAPCIQYAIAYATHINGFLILSPPREPSLAAPSPFDYESDLSDCQCGAPVCERNADCLDTFSDQKISVCEQGYCVHLFSRDCTSDVDCGDGYYCDPDGGACIWDVRGEPDRRGTPPPVCGDGVCEGPAETCTASGCPEDCGDPTRQVVPGFGRCELGDRCQLDRDCTEGACFHGRCRRLADGSACAHPSYCQSGSCGALSRSCISGCTLDSECETGVCSVLGECIEPLPNGFPCDANGDCASGVCNFPLCVAANSVPPGDLCTTDDACTSGDCVAGVCVGFCGDGYCTELPDLETCFAEGCQADCGRCPTGTPGCDEDGDCAGDLCRAGVCLERASLEPGQVCLYDEECTNGDCRGGFCGGAPNGVPCVSHGACASGVCNAGICISPSSVGLGGLCTASSACTSGTCLAGVCVCDSNSDCPSGKSCVANVCITVPTCTSNGGTCAINSTCCSGRCDGIPPECRAKLGNGSSCNENSDCQSGDCSFLGKCQ